jgi:ABC-2 type transport system permease protein
VLRPALLILRKDLRLRVRDRSVLLFGIVVPLALTAVFAFVFPDMEAFRFAATVVDEDGGPVAAAFVDDLVPALVADGVLVEVTAEDAASARALVDDGTIDAAWLLPAGLSDAVAGGAGAELEVLVNPDRALAAEVARGIAVGFAARVDEVRLAVATAETAGAAGTPDQLGVVAQVAAERPASLVAVEPLVAADTQLDPLSYLAAGMAAFFVFFTVQYGVTGLLEERHQGTLPRLLAAPIPVGAIHVGKAAGAFVLGVVSMAVLALGARFLLGAAWGPPLGVAVLVVALVVAATGLMAFVGSFARTADQAGNLQSIVAVSLGMLGGVFFPLGSGVLARLAVVAPHHWFLRGLGEQVASGAWTSVLPAAGAIAALGVVAAIPATLRLRRGVMWSGS